MNKLRLADTIGELQRLDRARTAAEVCAELMHALKDVGVDSILATAINPERETPSQRRKNIILNDWPAEWLAIYASRDYIYEDPVCAGLHGEYGAVKWADAFGAAAQDRRSCEIADGARAFDLRAGVTLNFPTAGAGAALLSLAGAHFDYEAADTGRMALIGQYAISKAICLSSENQTSPQAARLTRREHDILLWVCEGKTDWEISRILGISQHSADKYARRLKEKLNASTRTHLVAQAFRLGLI